MTFPDLRFGGLAAICFAFGAGPASAELQGDAEAIALADEMVAAMGGREAWATAAWLHAKERAFSLNHKNALKHEAWRGLQIQGARYRVKSDEIAYEQAWTTERGARVLNGEYLEFDEERLADEVNFWPREIYTMYHRFAVGDDALRLIKEEGRSFRVEHAETAAPMGRFSISPEGGPVVWSSGDTDDDVTYVYGPLKSFGEIKLPAWGAQTNGAWRFNYTDASLHSDALPADIFTLPSP